MSPPTRSKIWNYFSVIDGDSAMCNICSNVYSRKGRTTTSLKNHLQAVHPGEFELYKKSEEDKLTVIENTKQTSIWIPIQELNEQLPSSESLENANRWDKNDLRSKEVDRYVGEMIALQELPFSFVEGLGFRRLMQHVAPEYQLRGRLHFEDCVCDSLYEKLAGKIRVIVDGLNYKSFTADTWLDPSTNVSVLSLTCYGIKENFERVRIVLRCDFIEGGHTGDIISEKFALLLNEWNISKSLVHCMIRDEVSSMRRDLKLSSFYDLDCNVHKLQIAVRAGLKSLQNMIELIKKCEQIATHYNHSSVAQNDLTKIQEQLNQPVLNIFQNCPSSWTSNCYTFERLLEIKDALGVYSSQKPIPNISAEEWKIMQTCVLILKPFEEAYHELSNSSACISSVIPIVYTLTRMLVEYVDNSKVNDLTYQVASTIKENMNKLFSELENTFLYTIATYLDPRYKDKFFTVRIKENVEAEILRLCCKNMNQPSSKKRKISSDPIKQELSPSQSFSQSSNRVSSVLNNMVLYLESSSEDEDDDYEQKVNIELSNYLKEKRANISENPMKWWQAKLGINDHIRELVQRYLSPPAASISSEQLSNRAGQVDGFLRNRPTGEKVAKLLFLKHNLPLTQFEY